MSNPPPASTSTATPYPYGTYPYQPPAGYATGVTGYGAWPPYTYSYMPQTQPGARPQQTVTGSSVPYAPSATAQRSTFTSYTPSYSRESATATGRVRKQANFKGLFSKELKSLMYGFGDDRNPANDTVNVMEEILVEYITDVCLTAGAASRKSRLSIEDLRQALSRPADAKKLARMEELLFMQEDIKRARAQFQETDLNQTDPGVRL